jgi:hypothetical protein
MAVTPFQVGRVVADVHREAHERGALPTPAPSRHEKCDPNETRITDPTTGGEKGSKPEQMALVPLDVLLRYVAPHYAKGAEKYEADNWRKGYSWALSYNALQRHLTAFWYERKELDEETQTHHLAAVVFHALALLWFGQEHPYLDDRPSINPTKVDAA